MYYLLYPKRAYLIASEKGAKVNVVFFNFIMILHPESWFLLKISSQGLT